MHYNKEERTKLLVAFTHTLDQLAETAAQLTEAESAKAQAASAKEHDKMDSFLKKEQALLLKLRGLEQQRVRQTGELGFKDLTFRQILAQADEEEVSVLSPIFTKLERQLADLTEARESADRMIQVRLREFEHVLGTGRPGGGPGTDSSSHFHDRYV